MVLGNGRDESVPSSSMTALGQGEVFQLRRMIEAREFMVFGSSEAMSIFCAVLVNITEYN